jgi:GNAT superfamily N-acetyltransferase
LANSNSGFNPFNILRLLICLRRVKRVELGEIGLAETIRGKGISKALQAFRSKKMKEEGYTELDSGLTLVENIPVAKLAERVHDKYGNTRVTKYYTVRYMF